MQRTYLHTCVIRIYISGCDHEFQFSLVFEKKKWKVKSFYMLTGSSIMIFPLKLPCRLNLSEIYSRTSIPPAWNTQFRMQIAQDNQKKRKGTGNACKLCVRTYTSKSLISRWHFESVTPFDVICFFTNDWTFLSPLRTNSNRIISISGTLPYVTPRRLRRRPCVSWEDCVFSFLLTYFGSVWSLLSII